MCLVSAGLCRQLRSVVFLCVCVKRVVAKQLIFMMMHIDWKDLESFLASEDACAKAQILSNACLFGDLPLCSHKVWRQATCELRNAS